VLLGTSPIRHKFDASLSQILNIGIHVVILVGIWHTAGVELLLPSDGRDAKPERLDEVARMPIGDVAKELVVLLGLKRTAAIGSVKETRRVHEWISGERQPQRPEALRTALQAARLITDADDASVARAWFTGCNQHFAFRAPLVVIQEDSTETFTRIVRAAFEFARR